MTAPYLTMADIAALYNVSPSTARKWAAADHWRRKGTRPKRYAMADAQASYDKHHGGRVARHLVNLYAQPERIAIMKIEMRCPAGTAERFAAGAFNHLIGTTVPVIANDRQVSAMVVAVKVDEDGSGATITVEVPDAPWRPGDVVHPMRDLLPLVLARP